MNYYQLLQKHMADIEARASERVIEACVRTESVRKCVFTSSLLACIWPRQSDRRRRPNDFVDESCWSDETICRDKKVSLMISNADEFFGSRRAKNNI